MLHVCLDKGRFSQWCVANGLPAPRAWVPTEQARPDDLAPPFLIRPAETLHGAPQHGLPKAVEVKDEQELASWLSRFAAAGCRALVSESLLGQRLTQYSVPFARAKGKLLSFVARKLRPDPARCSVGTCVELAPHADAEALGRNAAEALDYFGIGEAEVLHSEATGRSYLIEINCRPWLQYPLAPASGHDFLGLLIDRPVRHRPRVKRGRRWVDLPSDLFGAFSSSVGVVRQGQLGVGAYVASLLKVNVFARFDARDLRPVFYRPAAVALPRPDVNAAEARPR
jgi:predicted ATP-grasp superfamily ATP-dependent carboligase